MKYCPSNLNLIEEYALGEHSALTAAKKAELEAHLVTCEECRHQLERTKQLNDKLCVIFAAQTQSAAEAQPIENIEVPQESMDRVYYNAMKAIRRKRRIHKALRVVRISAAAAAIIVSGWIAVCWSGLTSEPGVSHRSVAVLHPEDHELPTCTPQQALDPAAPRISETLHCPIRTRYAEFTDARSAFEFLQAEYEKGARSPAGGDFETLAELFQNIADTWSKCIKGVEALKMLAYCQMQVGRQPEYFRHLIEYAEELGEFNTANYHGKRRANALDTVRTRAVYDALQSEAARLSQSKDYFNSLALYDVIVSIFPDTEHAVKALISQAGVYEALSQYRQAIHVYDDICANYPDYRNIQRVFINKSFLLWKIGDREAAIGSMNSVIESENDYFKRTGTYLRGVLHSLDNQHALDAIRDFNYVIAGWPASTEAQNSQIRLGQLITQVGDDFLN